MMTQNQTTTIGCALGTFSFDIAKPKPKNFGHKPEPPLPPLMSPPMPHFAIIKQHLRMRSVLLILFLFLFNSFIIILCWSIAALCNNAILIAWLKQFYFDLSAAGQSWFSSWLLCAKVNCLLVELRLLAYELISLPVIKHFPPVGAVCPDLWHFARCKLSTAVNTVCAC